MMKRKSRGRPRKGASRGKTAVFSSRLTPELRKRLEQAAESGDRSLSDEIEDRLWRSFHLDEEREQMFEVFGGRQNYAVCRLFAELMVDLSASVGKSWSSDPWTYDQFAQGVQRLLDDFRPEGPVVKPDARHYRPETMDQLGEFIAAHQIAALEFTDPTEVHPNSAPRDRLRTYPRLKADLGNLWKGP